MTKDTPNRTPQQGDETRNDRRPSRAERTRYTISWGWFTAPGFGAAGSGGLEYEPSPERLKDAA